MSSFKHPFHNIVILQRPKSPQRSGKHEVHSTKYESDSDSESSSGRNMSRDIQSSSGRNVPGDLRSSSIMDDSVQNLGELNTLGDYVENVRVEGDSIVVKDKNKYIIVAGRDHVVGKGCRHIQVSGENNRILEWIHQGKISGICGVLSNNGEEVISTFFNKKNDKSANGKAQSSTLLLAANIDDRGINTLRNYNDSINTSTDLIYLPDSNSFSSIRLDFLIISNEDNVSLCKYASGYATNIVSSNEAHWPKEEFNIQYYTNTFPNPIEINGLSGLKFNSIRINIINNEGNGRISILCKLSLISLSC